MALKTFNVDSEVYRCYSEHCKKNGVSMSRKVENFIREELEKLGVKIDSDSDEGGKEVKGHEKHPMGKYC